MAFFVHCSGRSARTRGGNQRATWVGKTVGVACWAPAPVAEPDTTTGRPLADSETGSGEEDDPDAFSGELTSSLLRIIRRPA